MLQPPRVGLIQCAEQIPGIGKAFTGTKAIFADGWQRRHHVPSDPRARLGDVFLAHAQAQLGMVEHVGMARHAVIGQRQEKLDQGIHFLILQPQGVVGSGRATSVANVDVEVRVVPYTERRVTISARVRIEFTKSVAAPVIETHHILERGLAAVVKVGWGQADVAQDRGLERAVRRITRSQLRIGPHPADATVSREPDDQRAQRRIERVGCPARPAELAPFPLAYERQVEAVGVLGTNAEILRRRPHSDIVVAVVIERDATVTHQHVFEHFGLVQVNGGLGCARQQRTMVTVDAIALALEDRLAEPGFGAHRTSDLVLGAVFAIERRVVRNQQRLVLLDGKAPEQREVVLHLREAVDVILHDSICGDHDLGVVTPILLGEGALDQRLVNCVEAFVLLAGNQAAGLAEEAILVMHPLGRQRAQTDQLASQIRECLARARHFEIAQWRANGLRCEAGIVDQRLDQLELDAAVSMGGVRQQDASRRRMRVARLARPSRDLECARAERINAIELIVRATIPELPVVEYRVDHGRRLARLNFPVDQTIGVERVASGAIAGTTVGIEHDRVVGQRAMLTTLALLLALSFVSARSVLQVVARRSLITLRSSGDALVGAAAGDEITGKCALRGEHVAGLVGGVRATILRVQ